MGTLRAGGIIVAFCLLTVLCIPVQWLALKFNLPWKRSVPHHYHRMVCRLIGVRITVLGEPVQDRGVLLAANHTGWLDIPVLSAVARISYVAKGEIADWPFFGLLAKLQRTVFIHRGERAKAVHDRDQIRDRLVAGDALVIFPEGTSNDGNRVLGFKSALLSAAELSLSEDDKGVRHAPVQPVSIAYVGLHGIPMGRENRPFFAWYGDMELVPHLWDAFELGPVDVVVEFHPPLTIDEAGGRKELAALAEAAVRAGLARALSGAHLAGPAHRDEELEAALAEEEKEEAA
ncbi:MAG: lysophospholipid acyltransferase family protein [Alphaproteobacteria bacterium]